MSIDAMKQALEVLEEIEELRDHWTNGNFAADLARKASGQLRTAIQQAESEPVRVCVKVQGGEAHCTTGQWMSDEVGYLVVVPKEWQPAHPAPGVPDETINQVCYLATEIRFANSDDAAQAVIDRIRALLAASPAQKGGE